MALSDGRKAMAIGEGERLWKIYGITSPDDLALEDIAFARGVIVTEGALDKMEARLVRSGNRGLIRVKAGLPDKGRKRFAVAHELGHWELHSKVSQIFACVTEDMVAAYKASPIEAEANYFAAGLLMPEHIFMERARVLEPGFAALAILADTFRTSLTATAIRYIDTSDDYVAIVASSSGRVLWWRGSSRFEDRFWISPRASIGKNTIAAALATARGDTGVAGPEEVDMDAWSERGSEPGCDVFIEESVYMVQYGQALTLLRLP